MPAQFSQRDFTIRKINNKDFNEREFISSVKGKPLTERKFPRGCGVDFIYNIPRDLEEQKKRLKSLLTLMSMEFKSENRFKEYSHKYVITGYKESKSKTKNIGQYTIRKVKVFPIDYKGKENLEEYSFLCERHYSSSTLDGIPVKSVVNSEDIQSYMDRYINEEGMFFTDKEFGDYYGNYTVETAVTVEGKSFVFCKYCQSQDNPARIDGYAL